MTIAINLQNLGLCNRQAYVAMLVCIVSSMDGHEYGEQQIRDEVQESLEVALNIRREVAQLEAGGLN